MYSATLKFKRSLSACSREFVQSRSRYYSMLIHAIQNLPPNATRRPTSLSLRLHPERRDCGSLKLLPSQVSTAGSIQDATRMPKHNSQRWPTSGTMQWTGRSRRGARVLPMLQYWHPEVGPVPLEPPPTGRWLRLLRYCNSFGGESGIIMVISVNSPSLDSTEIDPPCCNTMSFDSDSPRPVP